MDGQQLISELLYKIYNHNGVIDTAFDEKLIGDENIIEASQILQTLILNAQLRSFVKGIENIILVNPDNFLYTPYTNTGTIEILDFTVEPLKGRNRNFFFSDTNIGFASSLSFFDNGLFVDFSIPNYLLLWKQIENFIERILSNTDNAKLISFIQIIETCDKSKGIFIDKTNLGADVKRNYSYIYLYALNFESRLSLDQDLKSTNRIINSALSLNPLTTYEQYIDVLDVLNEVNHTSDIVHRFLKVYHVLEYLVYRVTLSEIVKKVDKSKSFIRQVIQLSDNIKKSERDVFIKNFNKLFAGKETDFQTKINPLLTPDSRRDINELYLYTTYQPNVLRHNAELIYGIRCSIVHNKESELHITISNPDEYRNLIPIIKKLIEVLEELIIEKISINEPLIQYTKPQLNFY